MTRYTVVWHKIAEDNLARLWLTTSDRKLITAAANEIDRQLRIDAEFLGETVEDNTRQLVVPPLVAMFRVREADCVVEIGHVRLSSTS